MPTLGRSRPIDQLQESSVAVGVGVALPALATKSTASDSHGAIELITGRDSTAARPAGKDSNS